MLRIYDIEHLTFDEDSQVGYAYCIDARGFSSEALLTCRARDKQCCPSSR